MTATYQPADHVTIRDAATREVLATIRVGSRAVTMPDARGLARRMQDHPAIQEWVQSGTADLDREVIVADEYRY